MIYRNSKRALIDNLTGMTKKQILHRTISIENLRGMTVNERLYACGLIDEFDKAIQSDKVLAKKILTHLLVDEASIELILISKQ